MSRIIEGPTKLKKTNSQNDITINQSLSSCKSLSTRINLSLNRNIQKICALRNAEPCTVIPNYWISEKDIPKYFSHISDSYYALHYFPVFPIRSGHCKSKSTLSIAKSNKWQRRETKQDRTIKWNLSWFKSRLLMKELLHPWYYLYTQDLGISASPPASNQKYSLPT